MRTSLTCLLCLTLSYWHLAATTHADEPSFRVPPGQRQLFLDDHGVAQMENLTRTMHQPEKRGAVLRSPDPGRTVQIRTTPAWDSGSQHYKLWVHSLEENVWISSDGLHWIPGREPNQRLTMAVYDRRDPEPARRYKGVHLNRGFSVSPDGFQWMDLDVPKIQSSDEGNFSYDPEHGLFIHTVKRSGPYGRSVALATSRDFETWKDYGVVFHADARDQEVGRRRIQERMKNAALKQTEYNTPEHYSVQIYNMGVFFYEGLYIGLPSMYHHTGKVPRDWPGFDKMHLSPYILGLVRKYGDYTGFYNVQLVCSRDLVDWRRLGDRKPFIETSPLGAGAYDIQTIIGPSAPVVHDDELWFYYTGIKQYAFIGSGEELGYDDYVPDAGAVCLAVLRRDGFISIDAGAQEGRLTTQRFVLSGGQMFVNVAVRKAGRIFAEVIDESGAVVAVSEPLTRDRRRGLLRWKSGDLTRHQGKVVRLRFTLRAAGLYSYWLQDGLQVGDLLAAKFERVEGNAAQGAALDVGPANSWYRAYVSSPTVDFDGQLHRMWFVGAEPTQDPDVPYGNHERIGLAISKNGLEWSVANDGQPVLDLGGAGSPDAKGLAHPYVLRVGKRLMLWYGAIDGQEARDLELKPAHVRVERICLATSTDGVNWQRENGGKPVLDIGPRGSIDSIQATGMHVLKIGDEFVMWYGAYDGLHTLGIATSPDGIHWTKGNGGESLPGLLGEQQLGPSVEYDGKRYFMFYNKDLDRSWATFAASSDDGVHWRPANHGQPILGPPSPGSFGTAGPGRNHSVHPTKLLFRDGKVRVWYGAEDGSPPHLSRIGLMEARL